MKYEELEDVKQRLLDIQGHHGNQEDAKDEAVREARMSEENWQRLLIAKKAQDTKQARYEGEVQRLKDNLRCAPAAAAASQGPGSNNDGHNPDATYDSISDELTLVQKRIKVQ